MIRRYLDRRLLCLGLLSAGCLSGLCVQADTQFSLQLRWAHQFQFAGYYMALENGYYEAAGLDVEILEGGGEGRAPLETLLAGDADFAVSNSGVVIERMAGEPVVALAAVMQTSPIVWIVRADSEIYRPQDLAGKRLMLMPPPESAELLAMLVREGIEPDALELLPTSMDIEDLIRGDVDAFDGYESNEPYYLQRHGIDYRLIRPQEYGVDFYNDVLVTREDVVRQAPREVEAFREASLRGWQYALDNIEETVALIRARYAPEKSREHLLFEANKLRELIMPELVEPGHMNPGRWEAIAESYRELGMASGPLNLEGFLFTAAEPTDLAWLYRLAFGSAVAALLIALVAMRFIALNRRLVSEADRRARVEAELREKQGELYRLANTDPLTGAWNRLRFETVVDEEIERSRRYGHPLSLVLVDIDHFKRVNDEHGHSTGDAVLRDVTGLLQRQLRQSDLLFRWGGEELVLLAPHSGEEETRRLAERLREALATSVFGPQRGVTASFGVAALEREDSRDDLLARADRALYLAKKQGRNRVS